MAWRTYICARKNLKVRRHAPYVLTMHARTIRPLRLPLSASALRMAEKIAWRNYERAERTGTAAERARAGRRLAEARRLAREAVGSSCASACVRAD